MRNIVLIVFVSLLSIACPAQDWKTMMQEPETNLKDVQNAFKQWQAQYGYNEKEDEDGNFEQFKRWEWFMQFRTYPTGYLPNQYEIAKEYQDFLNEENSKKNRKSVVLSAAQWKYAGNTKIPIGGDDGRLNRIRFDPTNNNIIYACAPTGGLWKSVNGGSTWSTTTDKLLDIATSDVAIDPANTQILYLATGDGDGIDGGGFTTPSTIGVLKSVDGGNTWQPTSLYYTLQQTGPNLITVNQLLINPQNTNIVLAATTYGIYYSSDAGLSWSLTLKGDIRSMEFEPTNPSTVYAASDRAQFYRSTDGGQNFTQVTIPNSKGAGRMQLAVTPADTNYVYLLADSASDFDFDGLWLSEDKGLTFTLQCDSPNLLADDVQGKDMYGQGWYDLALAASPVNANEVLIGGVNVWRSTSAGVTGSWVINGDETGSPAPYVHADIHHLIYLNGTTYFAGCDGGIYKTGNSGKTWNDLSSNLGISQQYCIGLSAKNPTFNVTGWQDNGINMDINNVWGQVFSTDGMVCFIDYTKDSIIYMEQYYGNFFISVNEGNSFSPVAIPTGESAAWVTPWLQDPMSPKTLFAGRENVWMSTDRGFNWTSISTWGTSGNAIIALAVAPSNDSVLYAATLNLLYSTTDGGASWSQISGLPGGFTSIAVDTGNPLRVWVSVAGYTSGNKVFQSVNGGASWTNISAGLPNLPVYTLAFQGSGIDAMYAGTELGVYYRDTTNTGGEWVSYNDGLPNVCVTTLKIFAPGNLLFASTYGRGEWQTATYTASSSPPAAFFTGFPTTLCQGNAVQFADTSSNNPTSWNWTFTGGTPSSSTAQNPSVTYKTAGTFAVTLIATNSIGNNSITASNYITVNPTPPTPVITESYNTLSCTPSNMPFYQWYKSNTIIPGATSNQYTVTSKATYEVTITDSNGCSATGSYAVNTIGIDEITLDNYFTVFPNPAKSIIAISFNLPEAGMYSLSVSDVIGRNLYSTELQLSGAEVKSIDISGFARGVYFINLKDKKSFGVKKIIVL